MSTTADEKCFACGKPLRTPSRASLAITSDLAQVVSVGPDCFKRIVEATAYTRDGYQPYRGGPCLLTLTKEREAQFLKEHQQ
jgi:hypothetical protein